VIGCEDRLRNDLYCVGGALNSTQTKRFVMNGQYSWSLADENVDNFDVKTELKTI